MLVVQTTYPTRNVLHPAHQLAVTPKETPTAGSHVVRDASAPVDSFWRMMNASLLRNVAVDSVIDI